MIYEKIWIYLVFLICFLFMVILTVITNIFSENKILLIIAMGWLMVFTWFTNVINFFRHFRPDYLITSIVLLLCFCVIMAGLLTKNDNHTDENSPEIHETKNKLSIVPQNTASISKKHEIIHFSDNDDLKSNDYSEKESTHQESDSHKKKETYKTLHVHYKSLGDEIKKLLYGNEKIRNDNSFFVGITLFVAVVSVLLILLDSSFCFWIPKFVPTLYDQNENKQDKKKISNTITSSCYFILQKLMALGIVSITSEEISTESPLYKEIVNFRAIKNKNLTEKRNLVPDIRQSKYGFLDQKHFDYYNQSMLQNNETGGDYNSGHNKTDNILEDIIRYYNFNIYIFGFLVKNLLVDKITRRYQTSKLGVHYQNKIPKNVELKNVDPSKFTRPQNQESGDGDSDTKNLFYIDVEKSETIITVNNYDFNIDSDQQITEENDFCDNGPKIDKHTSEFIKKSTDSNLVREDFSKIYTMSNKFGTNNSDLSTLFIVFKNKLDSERDLDKLNGNLDFVYSNKELTEDGIKCSHSWSFYNKFVIISLLSIAIMLFLSNDQSNSYIPLDISGDISWISVGLRSLFSFILWVSFITLVYFNKLNRISSIICAIKKCEMTIYKIIWFSIAKEATNRTYVNISGTDSHEYKHRHTNKTNATDGIFTEDNIATFKNMYGNVENLEFELLNMDNSTKSKGLSQNIPIDINNQKSSSCSTWVFRTIKKSKRTENNVYSDNINRKRSTKKKSSDKKYGIHQMDVTVVINDNSLKSITQKINGKFKNLTSKVYGGYFDYFDGIRFSEYVLFLPLLLPIYIAGTLWYSSIIFLLELVILLSIVITEIFMWNDLRVKFTKSKFNLTPNWHQHEDISILADVFGFVYTEKHKDKQQQKNNNQYHKDPKNMSLPKNKNKKRKKKHKKTEKNEEKLDDQIPRNLTDDTNSEDDMSSSDISSSPSVSENELSEDDFSDSDDTQKKSTDRNSHRKKYSKANTNSNADENNSDNVFG